MEGQSGVRKGEVDEAFKGTIGERGQIEGA
jgi:hypothetical protein